MEPDAVERVHHLIWSRRSARVPFEPDWNVTPRELANLVEAARWAPSAYDMQNFQLVVVEDKAVLAELGAICAPVSPLFVAESSAPLASNGLPAPRVRRLGELIAGAPTLVVVVFDPTTHAPDSEHDVLGMMGLGCMLENMWLVAQVLHLDFQVLSTFAAADVAPAVEAVLGIHRPWRIAYALRIGHAPSQAASQRIRRNADGFVHRDHFAK
jgi:nitroreductase